MAHGHSDVLVVSKLDRLSRSVADFATVRGELIALRWEDLDLATGVIRVQRGWDEIEGEIAPKSRQGKRTVPIPAVLRDHLTEHRMDGGGEGRVFGSPRTICQANVRARRPWAAADLPALTLHGARHTFASLMIAAGVSAKALCTYMGHAAISTTFDLYGHLMPGNEEEAATLLDAYLAREAGGSTSAQTSAQEANALY